MRITAKSRYAPVRLGKMQIRVQQFDKRRQTTWGDQRPGWAGSWMLNAARSLSERLSTRQIVNNDASVQQLEFDNLTDLFDTVPIIVSCLAVAARLVVVETHVPRVLSRTPIDA